MRALMVVLVAMLVTVAGCQGEEPPTGRAPRVPVAEIEEYVAMGDSFVSGPAIAPKDRRSGICLRSTRNYPRLLAEELGISKVIDVSCAGAGTVHLTTDIPAPDKSGEIVRAQTAALTSRTQLVTVGIGYNDGAIFPKMLASCLPTVEQAAAEKVAADCQDFADRVVPELLETMQADVVAVLQETRRAASNATVLLVGYLPLLPELGACPADVVGSGDERSIHEVEVAVEGALRSAAKSAGTEFVSMRRAGRGHGMCAGKDAWVNGPDVADGDGVIVHPRAAGMRAVATAVAQELRN